MNNYCHFNHNASRGAHILWVQGATSDIEATERWHEASTILKTHKYLAPPDKIESLWWPDAQDLCTLDNRCGNLYVCNIPETLEDIEMQ
jgi:hypothetical protein